MYIISTLVYIFYCKISKLWQSVFQNYQDNSQCLSYAIYYYNCKEFGLKSAEEHAGVETSQYTCGENQQGKYIQFQTPDMSAISHMFFM
jgi:hypothetical protein